MPRKEATPRPQRQAVLVVRHGDGLVEVFPDDGVDVLMVDVPWCPGHETTAEDTLELMLPPRYRKLYFPGNCKASGLCREVKPSVLLAARQTAVEIARLNRIARGGQS